MVLRRSSLNVKEVKLAMRDALTTISTMITIKMMIKYYEAKNKKALVKAYCYLNMVVFSHESFPNKQIRI